MRPKRQVAEDQERRTVPRFDTGGGAGVRAQLHLALESRVLYLSQGGMMVRMGLAPAIGSAHRFTLEFGERRLDVTGVVRNVQAVTEGEQAVYDVGVEFDGLDGADREFIEGFVARRLA